MPGHGPNRARPYTLTGGRTRPRVELALEAVIETVAPQSDWPAGEPQGEVLRQCCRRSSIAEISAHMHQPIGVIRVVVGDLVDAGLVAVHATLDDRASLSVRRTLIERTLSGLRAL